MKKASLQNRDTDSFTQVSSCHLINTDPEKEYDYITQLACQICDVPIASISILDADRLWFKSKIGIPAEEINTSDSFCAHAMQSGELYEIEDATQVDEFKENPFVLGIPHVVFYAGQPIISSDGVLIGTLCVIDNKPRKLTDAQKKALGILGHQVRTLIDLRYNQTQLSNALSDAEKKSAGLIQNAKLVSLGRLAGGVAHEINNPLAIIGGRVDQLMLKMKSLPEDAKEKKLMISIKESVKRIKGIVSGMLEFSRDETAADSEQTSLNSCLDMVLPFFKEKCGGIGVEVTVTGQENVRVYVNRIQISQIIVNLVNNAIDATSEKTIRKINIDISEDDDFAYLKVSDNGPGIPLEKIDQVLEPFYTTKEPGKGTGLGLSISYGLAGKNNGKLSISKEYTKGAQFILKLPLQK